MLSQATVSSFETLSSIIEEEMLANYLEAAHAEAVRLNSKGMFRSGHHLMSLDRLGGGISEAAATQFFDALRKAHGAEPVQDVNARVQQLQALLDGTIAGMGAQIESEKALRADKIMSGKMPPNLKLADVFTYTERARRRFAAEVQIMVTGIAHNQITSMATSINITGPVGSVQTGSHSISNVTQTVVAPPARDEVLKALEVIQAAFQGAADQQAISEGVELIEDVRHQAKRDSPNRAKVAGLLQGLGTLVQTLPSIAPAWEVVTRWGGEVANALGSVPAQIASRPLYPLVPMDCTYG